MLQDVSRFALADWQSKAQLLIDLRDKSPLFTRQAVQLTILKPDAFKGVAQEFFGVDFWRLFFKLVLRVFSVA